MIFRSTVSPMLTSANSTAEMSIPIRRIHTMLRLLRLHKIGRAHLTGCAKKAPMQGLYDEFPPVFEQREAVELDVIHNGDKCRPAACIHVSFGQRLNFGERSPGFARIVHRARSSELRTAFSPTDRSARIPTMRRYYGRYENSLSRGRHPGNRRYSWYARCAVNTKALTPGSPSS